MVEDAKHTTHCVTAPFKSSPQQPQILGRRTHEFQSASATPYLVGQIRSVLGHKIRHVAKSTNSFTFHLSESCGICCVDNVYLFLKLLRPTSCCSVKGGKLPVATNEAPELANIRSLSVNTQTVLLVYTSLYGTLHSTVYASCVANVVACVD